jgi:hypothetical protein
MQQTEAYLYRFGEISGLVVVLPFWFIFSKAGYSKWLSLLMLVPVANMVLLYYFAFSTWPILASSSKQT